MTNTLPQLELDEVRALVDFAERGYTRELGAIDVRHAYSDAELTQMRERFSHVQSGIGALRSWLNEPSPDVMPQRPATHIPIALQRTMGSVIGHDDYAAYVLDGQRATEAPGGDDWHDVVALVSTERSAMILKFTQGPDQTVEHRVLAEGVSL
ncbi:hypothetical protein SAMN06295974_3866 [Plantibacter flavus]|uniref:Uncharacterized protein n=1 Tax=Plantibacter flavus TaxID=150123 RepID=A0A3N2BL60_9MICO|nr:hypothetical protein [Plantibacter flavus]ROR75989.1 hypothetical protein EDD42_3940 [Plantibacter flavus]SMG49574.1 hypothetical protein SAMN06295974_3866 [Plantibacter flavus]